MRHLLFSLELQSLKCAVLTLDEFEKMAAKYGIVGDEVSTLLQFLYLRIGVIQYFDIDGVRHIVIKETQVLFSMVTDLLLRPFTCKSLRQKEKDDFSKNGILTASVFESVVRSNDVIITSDVFLRILVRLRIIAKFNTPKDQEERYFVPCVLGYVVKLSEEEPKTGISPLCVLFKCHHCPKGLFGVLVTHFMTPETPECNDGTVNSTTFATFALIEDMIFRDQVSFDVCSPGRREKCP